MNYIRGAVNAISAPYQYYKDLPPINPSTLTGAIDVIVIQRPADNGGTELACSPFHVRFGKWQVLRPGEKKVNVFVNGNPIPFNMKIGEAGEAFFVFETDDDVPADLITSPLLQPTVPESDQVEQDPVRPDRFGAKQSQDEEELNASKSEDERVEPDFLDLDGGDEPHDDVRTTPKQAFHVPRSLRNSGSKATLRSSALSLPSPPPSRSHTPEKNEQDQRVDAALQVMKDQVHVPEVEYHHDIALDVDGYKAYHDRDRSDETVTSGSSSSPNQYAFPRQPSPSPPDSKTQQTSLLLPHTQSTPYVPSPSPSPSPSESDSYPPHPHAFRATSEPPPDMDAEDDSRLVLSIPTQSHSLPGPMQEYSWEWGAFPQPSPMRATFGKGGRLEPSSNHPWGSSSLSKKKKRKGRLMGMTLPPTVNGTRVEDWQDPDFSMLGEPSGLTGRSRSVPPQLDGIPKKGRKAYKEYEDIEDQENEEAEQEDSRRGRRWGGFRVDKKYLTPVVEVHGEDFGTVFGRGGTLSVSKADPTLFVLTIEGRKVGFQLSLVPSEEEDGGKGNRLMDMMKDEVESALVFDQYRLDLDRFLDDESVVEDPRLVIRWAGEQYITRKDGSPLMDALVHWRTSTLQKRASGDVLRPVSPPPMEDEAIEPLPAEFDLSQETAEHKAHIRSVSEPPSAAEAKSDEDTETEARDSGAKEGHGGTAKKPTSSSWVQWWSRSRKNNTVNATTTSAVANGSSKYPQDNSTSTSLPLSTPKRPSLEERSVSADIINFTSEPTTPVQHPADGIVFPRKEPEQTPTRYVNTPTPMKKFAKTLRLTSDQLKSLNLRPGANSITFSLSTSGAVAATARIFVWDSTDLVVISDIDGTITKSDGLGHVFAMIGRDWTHVGVAKLYTDIVKNGYKIMYLTSRAIGQADATRDYLKGIKQNNYQLPEGPVIMSPDRLLTSLHREVVLRKPEVFKMACLRDIQRLFGESARNPFYAGFGNRITDALSYRSVNVPSAKIFTIDSAGDVKMELLELAGYKSSYIHMTDLVDQMFPPIHRKWTPEFTDFNYWKAPVQDFPLPDLSPPSPALSARSDTSNQSALARLRNFSLGGSSVRPPVSKQPSFLSIVDQAVKSEADSYRSSHLRQMSSFEKLSSTLGFMTGSNNGDSSRRSVSPSTTSSYLESEDEDDGELDVDGRRQRRRSMTSMPGTLDETHFGMDDDDEDDHGEDGEDDGNYEEEEDERGAEEEAEEAFDDDLLAAGEMSKVPFL